MTVSSATHPMETLQRPGDGETWTSPQTLARRILDVIAPNPRGPGPAWTTQAAASAAEQVFSEFPELGADARTDRCVRSLAEHCARFLAFRAGTGAIDTTAPPAELVRSVREAVQGGLPLHVLLRTVLAVCDHSAPHLLAAGPVAGPVAGVRVGRRPGPTGILPPAGAQLTSHLVLLYVEEAQTFARGASVGQAQLVEQLLAGRDVPSPRIEGLLGLDLNRPHQAVVLWSDPSADGQPDALRRFAGELAEAMGVTAALIHPHSRTEVWMWVDRPAASEATRAGALRALLPPSGAVVVVGPARTGPEGFRRSLLSAQAAAATVRLGPTADGWLYDYSDIAAASLATCDLERARWFVEETLGDLASLGGRNAGLRETLRIYLACGRSRVLAAEQLHVAPNTVAYRVQKAVDLMRQPLRTDVFGLRLALEIARVLPLADVDATTLSG